MMMGIFVEPILNDPLSQLPLSPEFLVVCELAGFHSISEMLTLHTCDLLRLPGFNYHMLFELVRFLETRNLAHYIDPV